MICGGVVPAPHHDLLRRAGVAAIYPPGTHVPTAAAEILGLIRKRRIAA